MQHVLVTFGTRPEAIKMAPVVAALRRRPEDFDVKVCVTAQHRGMLDQVLEFFAITPDVDLDLMRAGQTLAQVTSRVLEAMTGVMKERPVDVVLVHGDTTTAMATALAAFYVEVPIGHVEAGLRSGRMDAPFPEEMNRVVIDAVARLALRPDAGRRGQPRRRGSRGRTACSSRATRPSTRSSTCAAASGSGTSPYARLSGTRSAWSWSPRTAASRSARPSPLRSMALQTARRGATRTSRFVYPVHPNPNVEGPARERLTASNIDLIPPSGTPSSSGCSTAPKSYSRTPAASRRRERRSGSPVLVLREVTERPELVEAGAGILVGTDGARILARGHPPARGRLGERSHGSARATSSATATRATDRRRLAGDEPPAWTPQPQDVRP